MKKHRIDQATVDRLVKDLRKQLECSDIGYLNGGYYVGVCQQMWNHATGQIDWRITDIYTQGSVHQLVKRIDNIGWSIVNPNNPATVAVQFNTAQAESNLTAKDLVWVPYFLRSDTGLDSVLSAVTYASIDNNENITSHIKTIQCTKVLTSTNFLEEHQIKAEGLEKYADLSHWNCKLNGILYIGFLTIDMRNHTAFVNRLAFGSYTYDITSDGCLINGAGTRDMVPREIVPMDYSIVKSIYDMSKHEQEETNHA